MSTRAWVRARVRRELGDVEAVQAWPDALINDHVGDAVVELSYALRRSPVAVTLATVAGQRQYALGVGVVDVVGVEFPLGTMVTPATLEPVPAEATPDAPNLGYAQAWSADIQAGTVRLENAPADSVSQLRVYYVPLLSAPTDDTTALPVEPDELAIVVLLACQSLWEARSVEDVKRGLRPGVNVFSRRVAAVLGRRRRGRARPLVSGLSS